MESAYRRELQRVTEEMQRNYLRKITAVYERGLSGDAFNDEMNKVLKRLADKWTQGFDSRAEQIARRFTHRIDRHTAKVLQAQFKKISADYKARQVIGVNQTLLTAVENNVALIKSIPVQLHNRISAVAVTSFSHNRDLQFMTKVINESCGVSKRRAALIARDQANKITNELAVQRSLAVGVTRGIWQHVPGTYSSRKTHLAMDGQEFDLTQGLYDSDVGRFVKPGELIACNCRYMAVIPGID